MNIFVLDTDISKCARYHADKHVVKMLLEGTQMLCTVLNCNGVTTPYKATHVSHPCTLAPTPAPRISYLHHLRLYTRKLSIQILFCKALS